MTHVVQKSSPKRRGFSLVLSLTIMAMILLMVITLASFLSIEARLAAANQLRTQARMQALVSLRLALAHLQQEAGPDRRLTFTGEMTMGVQRVSKYKDLKGGMWTGVQRTDFPFQPPSWIISGRHDVQAGSQSVSLAPPIDNVTWPIPANSNSYNPAFIALDYPSVSATDKSPKHWVPWLTTSQYNPPKNLITLVGDATGSAEEEIDSNDPLTGRPDGRVYLPAISLPDTNVAGSYCYWVGDEGVKANIALVDYRLSSANPDYLYYSRRGIGRTGAEILSGFGSGYTNGSIDSRIEKVSQLSLIASSTPQVFSDNSSGTNAKSLWPVITTVSKGVFSDARWGGLQIDLSTAFEKSEQEFLDSEFGKGSGSITWYYSGEQGANWALFKDDEGKITMPYAYGLGTKFATVWTIPDTRSKSIISGTAIRGPTWSALRDYHLLYREAYNFKKNYGYYGLCARTHYPNTVSISQSTIPFYSGLPSNQEPPTPHYSQFYNRTNTPNKTSSGLDNSNSANFYLYDSIQVRAPVLDTDWSNGVKSIPFQRPIPTKVAVQPYVARQQLVFGLVTQNSNELWITISPLTVLHNPYNIPLKVGKQRISFSKFLDESSLRYHTLYTRAKRTYTAGNLDPWTNQSFDSWRHPQGVLGYIKNVDSTSNNNECIRLDIDSMELKPGEFAIFTAKDFSQSSKIILEKGYNFIAGTQAVVGGFRAPYLDNSKTMGVPPMSTPQPLSLVNQTTTQKIEIGLDTCAVSLEPNFIFRHQLECWGTDELIKTKTNNTNDLIYSIDPHSQGTLKLQGCKDNLTLASGTKSSDLYNKCSLVAEHSVRPFISTERNGSPYGYTPNGSLRDSNLMFVLTNNGSGTLTNSGLNSNTPVILGVFDYGIRWPKDPSPVQLFARTNPMAAVTRVDASDLTWEFSQNPPAPPAGFANTSPSYKFEISSPSTWPTIDTRTPPGSTVTAPYGGNSVSSQNGVFYAIYTEVPHGPPISIAQYANANFGLRDQDALLSIGNSFAPLTKLGGLNDSMYSDTTFTPFYGNTAEADISFETNRALFDHFFLSGMAPDLPNNLDVSTVRENFITNNGSLANPRVKLYTTRTTTDTRTRLSDHRKVASVVLNEGAFNVHSLSPRAWAAILAGAKSQPLPFEGGGGSFARFPRGLRSYNDSFNNPNAATSGPDFNSANSIERNSAFGGLTALTDDQIKILAKNITWEIKYRTTFMHREGGTPIVGTTNSSTSYHALLGAPDAMNNNGVISSIPTTSPSGYSGYPIPTTQTSGSAATNPYKNIPCGFLGLSQFVNRSNCPVDGPYNFPAGAIQSAILHSDLELAKLNNRTNVTTGLIGLSYAQVQTSTTTNSLIGLYYGNPSTGLKPATAPATAQTYVESGHANLIKSRSAKKLISPDYSDARVGAPTALLQSDVLTAIGSALSVRSDTFTIRAYGDVSDKPGSPAAGSCWVEAVVQRIPDFIISDSIDPTQAPEMDVCDLSTAWKPNKKLQPANSVLGRRFVIVSLRILKSNEL